MGRERQKAKSDAARAKGLETALQLFSKQGFRGTTMRQIADEAQVSMGNLYYHFPSKEVIFEALLDEYWRKFQDPEQPINRIFTQARFPEDLEELSDEIRDFVEENIPYILLIYIDVIEFQGEHIKTFYSGMAERFQETYRAPLAERQESGEFGEIDPMFAAMCATRWFFYFYTVEKCFGVPMHLGMDPKQASDAFIRLLRQGLLPRPTSDPTET